MPVTQSADYIFNVAMNVTNVQKSFTTIQREAERTGKAVESSFSGALKALTGPTLSAVMQPITNAASNAASVVGRSAEAALPGFARKSFRDLAATAQAGERLEGLADTFARQGIPVSEDGLKTYNDIIFAQESAAARARAQANDVFRNRDTNAGSFFNWIMGNDKVNNQRLNR